MMTMTYETFVKQVESIPQERDTYKIIDPSHILAVWYGYGPSLGATLLIEEKEDYNLKYLPSTKGICVKNVGKGEIRFLAFMCEDQENEGMFRRLCYDILLSAGSKTTVSAAFAEVVNRFRAWCDLLDGKRSATLSTAEQKGLCGELLYLLRSIKTFGQDVAVYAWMGPVGNDQDFLFPETWSEVKVVAAASKGVCISSLEQLALNTPGTLAVYKLEKTSEADNKGFTLPDIVSEVLASLREGSSAMEAFEDKLRMAGYDSDSASSYTDCFAIRDYAEYCVAGEFPRLLPNLSSKGIVAAEYTLSLPVLESFKKQGEMQ